MIARTANSKQLPATPWGLLPPRLRVLFITGPKRTGRWLADTMAADRACEVSLDEVRGAAAGAAKLRDDVYDAILISHEPRSLDSLEVVDALRAGSSEEQPILVLGDESEAEFAALCFEAGADGYIYLPATSTRAFLWQLARARERHALITENRRLRHDQRHRLQMEHDEAARLLQQQHALVTDLEKIRSAALRDSGDDLAAEIEVDANENRSSDDPMLNHYRELLRTYVIMGSGNLTEELQRLAATLIAANLTAQQVMQLHLHSLEEAVAGLGSRSARHVMNRADLLILEVMLHLAEDFRRRWRESA